MPNWMQDNSVITYDDDMNVTVLEGGTLTEKDIEGRDDIASVGIVSYSDEMLAEPNTKVEYDLHGFIQNVYYLTPGTTDSYQLEKPQQ